jgi:hypothetical protein
MRNSPQPQSDLRRILTRSLSQRKLVKILPDAVWKDLATLVEFAGLFEQRKDAASGNEGIAMAHSAQRAWFSRSVPIRFHFLN